VNDKIPGLGLGPFGQWFTRHETWAEIARPWVSYLARSSYMLQQGKFVADVIYFYGEDSNITALFGNKAPDVPAGYNFDYVNADAIVHRLSVAGGRIVTPSGMSYRVLALDPNSRHMSLPVLHKIRDLVNAGAVVAGPKPVDSPSLSDNQAEFQTIVGQLWGAGAGEHAYGKGKVYGGEVMAQTQAALPVAPDFEYTKPREDTNLLYVHRKLADGEIYWVDNRNHRTEAVDASFRVDGKAPEIWHADTGVVEPAAYRIAGGRTTVPLHLDPYGAVFVVFRKAAATPSRTLPKRDESTVATIEGSWDVAFQPDRGAPAGWFQSGAHLWLDLGDVKNLAQVSVNGKPLGILWNTPFRVDVTGALKAGSNAVEVKVTNLWVNRLIGDQQPGVEKKYTYTTQQFYRENSPLLPSGLLGPVQVLRVVTE
jgi:(4-O-methyl)-D-glucuronate---lignin esterase